MLGCLGGLGILRSICRFPNSSHVTLTFNHPGVLPIWPPRDSSKGWLLAHQERQAKTWHLSFFTLMEKSIKNDLPKSQMLFYSPTNQDSAFFLGGFQMSRCPVSQIPGFPDSQISGFPDLQISRRRQRRRQAHSQITIWPCHKEPLLQVNPWPHPESWTISEALTIQWVLNHPSPIVAWVANSNLAKHGECPPTVVNLMAKRTVVLRKLSVSAHVPELFDMFCLEKHSKTLLFCEGDPKGASRQAKPARHSPQWRAWKHVLVKHNVIEFGPKAKMGRNWQTFHFYQLTKFNLDPCCSSDFFCDDRVPMLFFNSEDYPCRSVFNP